MQLKSLVASTLADPTGAINSVPGVADSKELQDALLKAEQVYNGFISLIDKAIKKLEDGKRELTSIKEKINDILSKLDTLTSFTDILNPIFDVLTGLFVAIDAGLALASSTFANGLVIDKLGSKKKDLQDMVKKGKGSLASISGISDYFNKETNKILNPLNKGINSFDQAIQKLSDLRQILVDVYEKFIESLILPQLNSENNDNETLGSKSVKDYISNEKNLNTILSDALKVGKGSFNDINKNLNSNTLGLPTSIVFKKFNQ